MKRLLLPVLAVSQVLAQPPTSPPAPPPAKPGSPTAPAPAAPAPPAPAPTGAAPAPTTAADKSAARSPEETRVANWREDLAYLASELPKRHKSAFAKCKKEDFEAAAAALDKQIPGLTDPQVVVGLMKLAAMVGDFHTGISAGSVKPPFHYFPISFAVFSDGAVIGAARESQKDLIGCTIVKFGETPIDEALRRAAAVIGYENDATLKGQAPRLLDTAEIAQAVGLIPTAERATLTVRDDEGKERTVELTPLAPGEKLAAAPMDDAKLPLYRQKHGSANWYELLPSSKAVYFHYERCADEPNLKVVHLTNDLLKAIDANEVQRVIVDLRGNGGGNSAFLLPFIQGMKFRATTNRPGGVVVLIGRGTFSSAQMNAARLKSEVNGAVTIGEPTGQKPNHYGEQREFVLPHSQLAVVYSTKYFQAETTERPSMEPDILVESSSKDFFEGRDPVLEAAIAYQPKQ